jgi:hypothetical protein
MKNLAINGFGSYRTIVKGSEFLLLSPSGYPLNKESLTYADTSEHPICRDISTEESAIVENALTK